MTDAEQRPPIARTLSCEETGELLGYSRDWWYRNHGKFVLESGFPPPLKAYAQLRWDRVAIERWFEQQMPEELRSPGIKVELNDNDRLETVRAGLRARLHKNAS